eukprot:4400229-Alexandrium_andersonii.AAC.1
MPVMAAATAAAVSVDADAPPLRGGEAGMAGKSLREGARLWSTVLAPPTGGADFPLSLVLDDALSAVTRVSLDLDLSSPLPLGTLWCTLSCLGPTCL